jgi:hypothetical protein
MVGMGHPPLGAGSGRMCPIEVAAKRYIRFTFVFVSTGENQRSLVPKVVARS